MSMNDKYYTPDIEEFHVGFLFELQSAVNKDEWCKCTLTYLNDSMFNVNYLSNGDREISVPDCMRVKYLDEQDIKSLGFKEDTYNGVKCFTKNNCQIFFFGDNVISIDLFAGEFRNQYFRGLVKNKSELEVILKQIVYGIIKK